MKELKVLEILKQSKQFGFHDQVIHIQTNKLKEAIVELEALEKEYMTLSYEVESLNTKIESLTLTKSCNNCKFEYVKDEENKPCSFCKRISMKYHDYYEEKEPIYEYQWAIKFNVGEEYEISSYHTEDEVKESLYFTYAEAEKLEFTKRERNELSVIS